MQRDEEYEATIEQSLNKMRDKLCVYGAKDLKSEWIKTISMSPQLFYDTLTKNLPDENSIHLEFLGNTEGEFRIESKSLCAEHYFSRYHKQLQLKEIKIEESVRRRGMGKALLENYINISKTWGIETIIGRAGREDGEFFWSKRGAFLNDFPKLKEQFIRDVRSNVEKIREKIGETTINTIENILSQNDVQMNFNLASMKETVDGAPIGIKLLNGTNQRFAFHLNNENQMKHVMKNLK